MTTTPDNLESQLRELTTHRGPEISLWQKALDSAPAPKSVSPIASLFTKPMSNSLMLGIAACIMLVLSAGFLLPSLSNTRHGAHGPVAKSATAKIDSERTTDGIESWKDSTGRGYEPAPSSDGGRIAYFGREGGDVSRPEPTLMGAHVRVPTSEFQPQFPKDAGSGGEAAAPSRHVIQKSTIELQTPDVRAVFAKCSHLLASGEFVENSSLTGDGKTAQANLTLRVAASRLSEVLNQLRTLGVVKSENTTGEDVTSQVVDLEARIRNEQRIEKELLELLDKRADAPLKDILELRTSLSTVRQSIEQYIAQRDRLGRLVSLASILVVIRAEPEAAPEPKPAQSITTYFLNSISETWRDGLRAASDSITWLLRILIGGAIWWLLLTTITIAILRYRRRLAARCV